MSDVDASGTAFVRAADVMSAPVDSDLVILNLARDDYVALDPIGRRIWDLLAEPRTLDELCRQLCDEFEGEADDIAADVAAFVAELQTEGLVGVVDSQPS